MSGKATTGWNREYRKTERNCWLWQTRFIRFTGCFGSAFDPAISSDDFRDMEEQATQLADTKPKLETSLRVAIPINVPERNAKPSRDQFIYNTTFSPFAIAQSYRAGNHKDSSGQSTAKCPSELGKNIVSMDHDALVKTSLKDFGVLAFSSLRAGKKDVEALAYASLGVIHDNQEEYLAAIDNYKQYLNICQELGDNVGAAAACNCIGVNFMELATPQNESLLSSIDNKLSELSIKHLRSAIEYHSKHLEIGPDQGGKFVANINIGLCLSILGEVNPAARHFQDALRIAIKMQTLYGQSIAVGNLGLLALAKKDFSTAKTCFDQVSVDCLMRVGALVKLSLFTASPAHPGVNGPRGRNRCVEIG